MNTRVSPSTSNPWISKIQWHLANRRLSLALRVLDRVIELDLPLFYSDPVIQAERRTAWLYRIDLLRSWGRLSEALAWTCFECEMNAGNVTAQALKETLKGQLHLDYEGNEPRPKRSRDSDRDDLWPGVAGMRELKAMLLRDVILPLQQPDVYRRYKVDLPNGILLYGPPGCGKTFIARKLADILQFEFIEVKPSTLASTYVHGGQEMIRDVFSEARENAPTLLFFDELDALVPDREGRSVDHHYSSEVNEFLVQLQESWKSKVLVVGATNLPDKIDKAVLRPGRLDKKVFVGPPDLEARAELLRLYMQDRPQTQLDWADLAVQCQFYTAAELEHIVNEAARMAIPSERRITVADFKKAMANNPPMLGEPGDRQQIGFRR